MDEQTQNPPPETTENDALAAYAARAETAEAGLAETRARLAGTVAAYRDLARTANPGVPAEMIDGDSVEAIAEAAERAKAFAAEAVRLAGIAQGNGHAPTVPTGSQTFAPDHSALSPVSKMTMGFAAQRNGR